MTRLARAERLALCDTFERVGPDAPTLCEGWATRDLAAHVVIRESRPDLAAGMFVKPLAGRLESASERMAAGDWPSLVDRVRKGPPKVSPMRLGAVDERMNLVEFFIHHEDVLRAQPDWTPEDRRSLPEAEQSALWKSLRLMGRPMFRKSPVGVVLLADGHGRYAVRLPGEGQEPVVVRGAPAELVLFAYGRKDQAVVELTGSDEDVAALRGARLGLA